MKKKFLVFLVEGHNDELEISAILHSPCFDAYRDKYVVKFLTKGGDITSKTHNTKKNIQEVLDKILLNFRYHGDPYHDIKVSEIQEFVQIVDLDGAFVSDDHIVVDKECSKLVYGLETITADKIEKVLERNNKKSGVLKILAKIKQVGNVPYSVYFASCNMDHLLFDKQNPSQDEKNDKAHDFMVRCSEDQTVLEDSIFKQGIMATGSYDDSWEYIMQDCNSLQRHTNINLFLGENAKNPK